MGITKCYSFNESGNFKYNCYPNDQTSLVGCGEFKIKGNKLLLEFVEKKNFEAGYHKISKNLSQNFE